MQTKRSPLSQKTRRQVLERDGRVCRKCNRIEDLNIHHIHPVAEGGTDESENLITLCEACHHEWEHLIFVKTDKVTFDEWLPLPPVLVLVALFAKPDYWSEHFNARQIREMIMQSYHCISSYSHDKPEEDVEYEGAI